MGQARLLTIHVADQPINGEDRSDGSLKAHEGSLDESKSSIVGGDKMFSLDTGALTVTQYGFLLCFVSQLAPIALKKVQALRIFLFCKKLKFLVYISIIWCQIPRLLPLKDKI